MHSIITILTCAALLVAGLIGITLSVPLQAPAVILFGLAAILAAIQVVKCGSAGVRKSGSLEVLESQVEGRRSKSSTWLLWFVVIAIAYFVGRACWSPVFDLGIEDLMLILPAAILYLIAGYGMGGKAGVTLRQGLAWVVIALLLLHLGSCFLQLQGGDGYSLSFYLTGAKRASADHITGMYGYYGSFANFAVIAGLLCLSLGVWGRLSYRIRALIFLLGLAALILALYSQSRSAAVSLVFALGVFGVLLLVSLSQQNARVKHWAKIAVLSSGSLGFIGGLIGGAWVFTQRGGISFESITDSGVRSQFWAMAGEQWVDHPWFGAGSRSFSYECFRNWSPNLGTNEANPEFVHNEYLQLLADYGLIGLMLILGLFGWHFYRGAQQVHAFAGKVGGHGLKRGSNAMALAVAGMSGMTAMAVHICFDFRTHLLANLLLLVCCAVWILPVAKSRVRELRSAGVRKLVEDRKEGGVGEVEGLKVEGRGESRGRDGEEGGVKRTGSLVFGLVLFVLGFGAVGLGGQQLWAGLPLIQHKMAKEDGAWNPESVDRDVWIPTLEESLARAPQWRRYQRLGTLYRLEANANEELNEASLQKAQAAYEVSIERHPYNPISRMNLAAIYSLSGEWEKADAMYASASEMAKAHEWWLRLPVQWANMQRQRAGALWKSGNIEQAEIYYQKAQDIIKTARVNNGDATTTYLMIVIDQARMEDSQHNFTMADELFENAEKRLPNYSINSLNQNIRREMGEHYLRKGKYLWYQRKPEEAHTALVKASRSFHIHQIVLKGREDKQWEQGYDEVKSILKFFKATGVGNE